MGDPEMKAIEAQLREMKEHANEVVEKVTTLAQVERMVIILAQRKAYVKVERLRDQHKVLKQILGPRLEEVVNIIGELVTIQGKVKQVATETDKKLQYLTAQAIEEFTKKEATFSQR
jgi:hypothetical protein